MVRRFQFSLEALLLAPLLLGAAIIVTNPHRNALGCLAADLWQAFRETAFETGRQLWPGVGSLMIVLASAVWMAALIALVRRHNEQRDDDRI